MEAQNVPFAQLQLGALDVNRYQYADFLFLVPQFKDEETFFITSDFPVSMIDFTNMNTFYPPTPMDATVEVTIPLTPKIALLVNNIGLNGYKEIDHNFMQEINYRTLRRSNKFIISPQKLDDKFTEYNVKRSPQSFLLLFISDKLRAKRHNKVQKILKNNVSNLTRLISNDIINAGIKMYKAYADEKDLIVGSISIYTQSREEMGWFSERMDSIGKKLQASPAGLVYQLKKPIKTKSGLLSFVTIASPVQSRTQRGYVIFEIKDYALFKSSHLDNAQLQLSSLNSIEVMKLTDERFNIFVYVQAVK